MRGVKEKKTEIRRTERADANRNVHFYHFSFFLSLFPLPSSPVELTLPLKSKATCPSISCQTGQSVASLPSSEG